ncbi:hypothetical protein TSA6c_17130 [Azospirillum sp. TSA6c]|uniref:twin-arginine translocation signal domain-containing protein n=1 Tax=Azospirillum sp. TSA6c TaxID=709813 RepID=UPI000D603938|nr:twin-arginine translocation signal domain-containing protein [Azospirillum sp. TSA6c]PWC48158.1 hypothetical protein TSA6c_17130 [Azospirillum sp. TSA6c]
MLEVSRRRFLRGLAAAPIAAALAPVVINSSSTTAGVGIAVPAPEFGYLLSGRQYWATGFSSRAEAIAEAAANSGGAAFETAETISYSVTYPDFAEAAAEWLWNDGHLGNWLIDALTAANGDGDFEGEFSDACNRISREPVGNAGRAALGSALRRQGATDLADKVEAGETPDEDWEVPDVLVGALQADPVLGTEIGTAVSAWVSANNLEDDLHGLMLNAVERHPAPAPAEHAPALGATVDTVAEPEPTHA